MSDNSDKPSPNISPARPFALLILFIGLVSSGIALSVTVSGNTMLAVQICGGAVILAIVVWVIGAFIVGRVSS